MRKNWNHWTTRVAGGNGAYKSITLTTDNRNKNISYVNTESLINIATLKGNLALFNF